MNYLKKMFSSDKTVSFGRIMSCLCLVYVMALGAYIVAKQVIPAFPAVGLFWQVVIPALFGISKGGDAAESFSGKKGAPVDGTN